MEVMLEAYKWSNRETNKRVVSDNLLKDNPLVIPIAVEGQAKKTGLALKLRSRQDNPLYAWIFCFNMATLDINTLYKPNFAKNPNRADPSLPPKGELTIYIELPTPIRQSVMYIRIFLTTERVDLSRIECSMPKEDADDSGSPWAMRAHHEGDIFPLSREAESFLSELRIANHNRNIITLPIHIHKKTDELEESPHTLSTESARRPEEPKAAGTSIARE